MFPNHFSQTPKSRHTHTHTFHLPCELSKMQASLSNPGFWINSRTDQVPACERIKSIKMTVLTETDIYRLSTCEVRNTTLYEKSLPRAGGINDMRMGPADDKLRCGTCQNGILKCTGHVGHIELAVPVYHVAYIPYLVKILKCVCVKCFRLLIPRPDRVLDALRHKFASVPKTMFTAICTHLKKKTRCGHADCKFIQPTYAQVGLVIKREWTDTAAAQITLPGTKKRKRADRTNPPPNHRRLGPLTPALVQEILDMVDVAVFEFIGCRNPSSFILTTLLVPPPIIRPSIMFSESSRTRGQDDLTHKLQEILKTSQKITNHRKNGAVTTGFEENLQTLVAMYMNNECAGIKSPIKKRSGNPEKCIVKRLKGKKGRVRGNLMGKRVNFSARSVISPGCSIDVDEVGVPLQIAKKLTFTETVNTLNFQLLTDRVRYGHASLRGAKSITDLGGVNQSLEFCKNRNSIRLQLGWKVERYLQTGDVLLLNRQPSLRKKSIMAHKVRLMPGKTFRLNLSCTEPYNADFDGNKFCSFSLFAYTLTFCPSGVR